MVYHGVTFEGTPDKYELQVMNHLDYPITIKRGDKLGIIEATVNFKMVLWPP
jgi:hypothetical protein